MDSSAVKLISECFIKPKYEVEHSKSPHYLSPWGLTFLSVQYIQSGLLFSKLPQLDSLELENHLERLKASLSLALVHFYPLAGQLATRVDEDQHKCLVYLDSDKGPGAKFIYATLEDMTVSDILSPTYVPLVVQSFFDLNGVTNHDGHTRPLLSVQVTELLDGVFIGASMNHAVADGTSFWHFWNTWSEIHEAMDGNHHISISHPPVYNFSIPNCCGPDIWFPFTHPEEFISRQKTLPQLRAKVFYFSSESIRMLKERANKERDNNCKISSLQALTALVWRSIARANRLSPDQVTKCGLSVNNRPRLDPSLPQYIFNSSMDVTRASTTVGELLEHPLGWVASLVHQSVASRTDKAVLESLKGWLSSPFLYQRGPITLMMTMSPRFDIYRNEFGVLGKPLAARSGCNNTHSGNVVVYPGCEGGGSMDLQICLPPDSMKALESDKEFMSYAVPS